MMPAVSPPVKPLRAGNLVDLLVAVAPALDEHSDQRAGRGSVGHEQVWRRIRPVSTALH